MEEMIKMLEETVKKNEEYCKRILHGKINEGDAVYIPELPGEKTLSDREIYIYHKAFNDGVKRALEIIKKSQEPEEDLLSELF